MNPTEIVAKLTAQLASIKTRQNAALAASQVEGVTAEDRAKHIAEFDRLQTEKEAAQADLKRAEGLVAEEVAAEAKRKEDEKKQQEEAARREREPAREPLVTTSPGRTNPNTRTVPATARRFGPLKAFKGQDAELRAYKTGLWVAAAMYGHKKSLEQLGAFGLDPPRQTMSTADNNKGGYFVPDFFDTAIIELQEEYGVVRRLADVESMTTETWKGPRWTNNMVATWVSQGNAPAQSEPGWDQIELVAKDLAAYGKMTVQLNEDSIINLGDKWAMAAAVAFTFAEDNAAFNGDGTSQYGGILGLLPKVILAANAASLYTATGETSLGALTMGSFTTVVGRFPNYPGANPRWLCHKEVWAASMARLQLAAGGLTAGDVQEGAKPRFLGYDVEWVNVMPKAAAVTTGVTGILFADLNLSTKFGDRRQRSLRTGEINDDMIKQLMTIFAASRVDIVNHTIVDPKTSTVAGPVIGLKLG